MVCRPCEDDEFRSTEGVCILETWNVADDPGLSIARARLGPGEASEAHALDGTTERYLVVRGVGEVRVGRLAPTAVGPGDVVLVPPGAVQSIRNTGADDLCFYCICTPRFDEADYASSSPVQDTSP